MPGYEYCIQLPSTAIAAAKTLIQVKAGSAAGLLILSAKLWQVTKTTSELWQLQGLRKTAAATVTSFTPLKMNSGDPAALCVGGTSATGYNASAEGTDGDVLVNDGWNILNGVWQYLPVPEDRVWVPAGGIFALKLITVPGQSTTMGGEIHVLEMQ